MFKKKKKHGEYLVLTEEELQKKGDEVEVLNVVQEDVIVKMAVGSGSKEVVLRKAKYLCAVSRDETIKDLKMKLSVGEDNFEEYYDMKQQVAQKDNEIKHLEGDMNTLRDRVTDTNSRLEYLKRHLGRDAYINLMNNHDRSKKGEETKSKVTKASPLG